MLTRVAKIASVAAAAALVLTGCTPPMPPEVQAALAEQVYTCVDGTVTTSFPAVMADAEISVTDSLSANCAGMAMTPAADAATADLVINDDATSCDAYNTVPYALDAALVVGVLPEASGLVLKPATVQAIFDGSITSWDDPAITADNDGIAVGSGAINLYSSTTPQALAAFAEWYQHLTGKKFVSRLTVNPDLSSADLLDLPDNSVALLPYSVFTEYSINAMTIPYSAAIVVDAKTNPLGVVSDAAGVASAGTQLVAKKTASGIGVQINHDAKPLPPEGSDIAPEAYGAIYPVLLSQCGTDTKTKRAVARYLLRQDSQGALTTYVALPEAVRAEALVSVSKGLKIDLPEVPNQ